MVLLSATSAASELASGVVALGKLFTQFRMALKLAITWVASAFCPFVRVLETAQFCAAAGLSESQSADNTATTVLIIISDLMRLSWLALNCGSATRIKKSVDHHRLGHVERAITPLPGLRGHSP